MCVGRASIGAPTFRESGDSFEARKGSVLMPECEHDLGDSATKPAGVAGCEYDLEANRVYGLTVDNVVSRIRFDAADFTVPNVTGGEEDDHYNNGEIYWRTGNNEGTTIEVQKFVHTDRAFTLEVPMRRDIQVGDEFDLAPGCSKVRERCEHFRPMAEQLRWVHLHPWKR